jgi:Uma2 family endonuclease
MAISDTIQECITGEALFQMQNTGRCELVKGRVIQMSPASGKHGAISMTIGALLHIHVKSHKLGKTYAAETGVYIQRNPDTVRAPDAMFISNERQAQINNPAKFIDVAPDLAVEVLSPNDTWTEVETKIDEYFSVGVRLIWAIDPDQEIVAVYHPSGERSRLTKADTLTGGNVLPDFSVPVTEIFE